MDVRFAGRLLWLGVCLAAAAPAAAQEAPSRPAAAAPAASVGTVSGTVLDKSSGEPIIDAGIEVVGQKRATRSDLDGKYALKLPPGTYEIRIFAAGFQAVRLQNVSVAAGQTAKADAALAAAGKGGLVVEVTAQAKKSNEATQILKRQKAIEVRDTISAEQVKKSPGSDAKDVVQRAPAVTIKDDKYLFVRGLGDRYSSAVLNGSRLPSTDPQRRVVPLDLFPATFLDSLSVIKTYAPNLPGDFAGGLLDLDLRDHPDQLEGSVSAIVGGNTQSTFQDFQTYQGSSWDVLGMGEGYRELPSGVPSIGRAPNGQPIVTRYNDLPNAQRFSVARQFRDIWAVDEASAPLNDGFNFSVGDKWGGERWGTAGAQLGGIYSSEYKQFANGVQRQLNPTNGSSANPFNDDFTERLSQWVVKTGGIFTGDWQPNDRNRLTLRTLINRVQTISVDHLAGTTANLGVGQEQRSNQLSYLRDQLGYGQLTGEHKLGFMDVGWKSALSETKENQPDTRFDVRIGTPGQPFSFTNDSNGASRIYSNLREWLTDSAVDLSVPFKLPTSLAGAPWDVPLKFSFGPAYSFRDRNFQQRRFQYMPFTGGTLFDYTEPTQQLLQPSNIGPDGFDLQEETQLRDIFDAHQAILGGYGMFEIALVPEKLFFTGGSRAESSDITLNTSNDVGEPFTKTLDNLDPMPSVSTRWAVRPDMNLRAGWSQTVSRPEFRELSPAQYPALRGKDTLQGNPFLVETQVENVDFRWEWFFGPLELVSASFFHKTFTNPIEQVVIPSTSTGTILTYANFASAELTGFELEGRKDLGALWSPLRYFSVQSNYTWAASRVDRASSNLSCATAPLDQALPAYCVNGGLFRDPDPALRTPSGRMFDQAPWILNASIEYAHPRFGTARLLYYTADQTVVAVGKNAQEFPNRLFQRRDQFDAVLILPLKEWLGQPLTAQLTVENILNSPNVVTQGPYVQQKNAAGTRFTFGLTYAF